MKGRERKGGRLERAQRVWYLRGCSSGVGMGIHEAFVGITDRRGLPFVQLSRSCAVEGYLAKGILRR